MRANEKAAEIAKQAFDDAISELEDYADSVMPGWRPLEQHRRRLIDMPVVSALPRWDVRRPGVALGDAPGVFIAGDWVGDAGMLSDVSAASAQEAAKAHFVSCLAARLCPSFSADAEHILSINTP